MQTESLRGLTAAEVADRVARGAVNAAPPVPTRSVRQIVRANVLTRFNALLGAMLVIILAVGPAQDALFGFVLVANSLIGIVQELRAKRTLDRLTVLTAPMARVLRDGDLRDVNVGEVVLDDVLELRSGDQVVVDGDVVGSTHLEVDESLLTGESEPAMKEIGESVLSGSFVVAGAGRYRATRVGPQSYAARLAEEARRFTLTRSELRAGVDRILRFVTIAIVPTAILLFASQFRAHQSVRSALSSAVAGTVAMVPEGLVLLTNVAFAVGVVRLARRRVLVQELPAVEGLARVDVLCIDKTGTLTEGRLVVEDVEPLAPGEPYETAFAALAAADVNPNATLRAVAEHFAAAVDTTWQATTAVAFSSARKWSAATFEDHGTWVLGAPDVVLRADDPARVRAQEPAELGQRVLVLARSDRPLDGDVLSETLGLLVPVALVMLGDRPRDDAAATLAYFAEQGVIVKVISGDHPAPVAAFARRLGAAGADDPVDATLLPTEAAALADVMDRSNIFGRVGPQQKRDMVRALQSRGHVVAMTGDGVNDVLALKEADIGVAMGSGSAATRAVAQLVLLDSDFDALPPVVAEGRRVLGNIERTSGLYLTKTVYAMLLALAVGVAGLAFPFLPRHLTLIGSVTIGIPSFFLALAPNAERARPGFLARVARFAIPAGALSAVATFLAYRIAQQEPGITLAQARTSATMVLTWIGLLVLSIIAAPLTRPRLLLVWSMAGLAIAALVLPPTRAFFALDTPEEIVWLAGFGIAAIVWSFARLFVPGDRPIGPTPIDHHRGAGGPVH